jgi:hypothetical protein
MDEDQPVGLRSSIRHSSLSSAKISSQSAIHGFILRASRLERSAMKHHFFRRFFVPMLFAVIAALCPWRSGAMDIIVSTNADNGNGSLRQAILFNAALGGGNKILFSNSVSGANGTITLTSGELLIDKDLIIEGPGAQTLTISGNNLSRVFHVTGGATVTLSGMTVKFGRATNADGGGILFNSGNLTVNRCVLMNNVATALGFGGGGGISQVGGTLSVSDCTIANCSVSAGYGGGILLGGGTQTLRNVTITGNGASGGTAGSAGGIQVLSSGTLEMTNCTVSINSGNSPGAGILIFSGTVKVRNSIIANNSALGDCQGNFVSGGFNLIGSTTGSTGFGVLGDQTGTSNSPINPKLSPLQYNGGPTPTMAPLTGSPVIDQGAASGSSLDQRGRTRPFTNVVLSIPFGGDHSDIGAVELGPPVLYEWTFEHGNLSAALGPGTMSYADAATPGLTSFGTTDGTTVPHIGGLPTRYMHVPAFTGLTNGYMLRLKGSEPNGGGTRLNEYTFLADLLLPTSLNWMPFFNTDISNGNDADFYVGPNGAIGIFGAYSAPGTIGSNTWYRVAFVARLGVAQTFTIYVNGSQVAQYPMPGLDDRWSMLQNNPSGDLLLFNEGDLTGDYTHEIYVAHVGFVSRALSAAEIAALGAPASEGIFARHLNINRSGGTVALNWRSGSNVSLQKSTNLASGIWQTLSATLGASVYNEPATNRAFYRLTGP